MLLNHHPLLEPWGSSSEGLRPPAETCLCLKCPADDGNYLPAKIVDLGAIGRAHPQASLLGEAPARDVNVPGPNVDPRARVQRDGPILPVLVGDVEDKGLVLHVHPHALARRLPFHVGPVFVEDDAIAGSDHLHCGRQRLPDICHVEP